MARSLAVHLVTHDGIAIGVIGPHRLRVLAWPRKNWSMATREARKALKRWTQPIGVELGPASEPPPGVGIRAWAESVLAHAVAPARWDPPAYRPRSASEDVAAVPSLRRADPDEPDVPHPLYPPRGRWRPRWTWSAHAPRYDGASRGLVTDGGAVWSLDCGRRIPPNEGAP